MLASVSDESRAQQTTARDGVQVQMRNVDFRVDSSIVLHIDLLRGSLSAVKSGDVPFFDDKRSFVFQIDTARIALNMRSLSDLLNRYVFAYRGSPLHNLSVSIVGDHLKQRAVTRGMTVTTVSEVSVTPSGDVRLHPVSIKAAGIPVRGVMHLFGLRLSKVVNLNGAHGVRFDGDDLLLSVSDLLPPPAIRGHLTLVALRDSQMIQVFRPANGVVVKQLIPTDPSASNYMYFRGGVLRFGKLTMTEADLLIVDADPRDPFDFFLDRYNDQLVAGYSRNTLSKALIAVMPDYNKSRAARRLGGIRPSTPPDD
jgi:hypothetical protein